MQPPTGSDILEKTTHELKLEKSNILLLGPTGSGIKEKFKSLDYAEKTFLRENFVGSNYSSMFRCSFCNL